MVSSIGPSNASFQSGNRSCSEWRPLPTMSCCRKRNLKWTQTTLKTSSSLLFEEVFSSQQYSNPIKNTQSTMILDFSCQISKNTMRPKQHHTIPYPKEDHLKRVQKLLKVHWLGKIKNKGCKRRTIISYYIIIDTHYHDEWWLLYIVGLIYNLFFRRNT